MSSSDDRQWDSHPRLATALRWGIWIAPLVVAIAVSFGLRAVFVSVPLSTPIRLAVVLAAGLVTFELTTRVARRFLPLTTLLRLALVFPDQAPARFGLALRSATTKRIERSLEDGTLEGFGDDPQANAERLLTLVGRLNDHDRLTRGHSERVRAYTDLVGAELGLDDEDLGRLRWAALLHDVGKLRIDEEILNKPGRPTAAEWDVLRQHPEMGEELVAPIADWLGEWAGAVRHHHERWDGGGYPDGLAGEDIPLAARIVCVTDAFDVMTSARSYKAPFPRSEALAELTRCAGSQFDPAVVRAFLAVGIGAPERKPATIGLVAPISSTLGLGGVGAAATGTGISLGPVLAAAALIAGLGGTPIVEQERAQAIDALAEQIEHQPPAMIPTVAPPVSTTEPPVSTVAPTVVTTLPPTTVVVAEPESIATIPPPTTVPSAEPEIPEELIEVEPEGDSDDDGPGPPTTDPPEQVEGAPVLPVVPKAPRLIVEVETLEDRGVELDLSEALRAAGVEVAGVSLENGGEPASPNGSSVSRPVEVPVRQVEPCIDADPADDPLVAGDLVSETDQHRSLANLSPIDLVELCSSVGRGDRLTPPPSGETTDLADGCTAGESVTDTGSGNLAPSAPAAAEGEDVAPQPVLEGRSARCVGTSDVGGTGGVDGHDTGDESDPRGDDPSGGDPEPTGGPPSGGPGLGGPDGGAVDPGNAAGTGVSAGTQPNHGGGGGRGLGQSDGRGGGEPLVAVLGELMVKPALGEVAVHDALVVYLPLPDTWGRDEFVIALCVAGVCDGEVRVAIEILPDVDAPDVQDEAVVLSDLQWVRLVSDPTPGGPGPEGEPVDPNEGEVPGDDAPTPGTPDDVVWPRAATVEIDVLANDTDVDGEDLVILRACVGRPLGDPVGEGGAPVSTPPERTGDAAPGAEGESPVEMRSTGTDEPAGGQPGPADGVQAGCDASDGSGGDLLSAGAAVAISDDGRRLVLTVVEGADEVLIRYVVSDPAGLTAEAVASVSILAAPGLSA